MADLTVEILKEIRDEIRGTNERLDQTRSELSERIDQTRSELSARIGVVETRVGAVEGAVLDLAEQQRFVVRYLKAPSDRDARLDVDVAELRVRVEALEAKVGDR